MTTERQLKANRQNAKRSTGPKTYQGKKVVAANAVKHGLSRSIKADARLREEVDAEATIIARQFRCSLEDVQVLAEARIRLRRVAQARQQALMGIKPGEAKQAEKRLRTLRRYESKARFAELKAYRVLLSRTLNAFNRVHENKI